MGSIPQLLNLPEQSTPFSNLGYNSRRKVQEIKSVFEKLEKDISDAITEFRANASVMSEEDFYDGVRDYALTNVEEVCGRNFKLLQNYKRNVILHRNLKALIPPLKALRYKDPRILKKHSKLILKKSFSAWAERKKKNRSC